MRISIAILLLWVCLAAQAQPINKQINEVIPPTPEAAALGQYLDTPIDYVTGTPSITVPIHTVEEGSLSATVGVSYHASGIKASQLASRVGLGFTLVAGGMVTRQVQGLPDDVLQDITPPTM